MNTRERFHAVMNFQPFDRLPIIEWAVWWDKTLERWHGEGLPSDLRDRYDLYRHFDLDVYKQDWISTRSAECPAAEAHGEGIIESMEDYERIRPLLYPEKNLNMEKWRIWAAEQASGESVLWLTIPGFFWHARELLGIEPHLYAFYDQPELLHRINRDLTEYILAVIERIGTLCRPDFMVFAEDMSYNHGSMISEEQFEVFMRPYYAQVVPVLKQKGILSFIDSDGDITRPLDWFARAGLDGVLPLERQAGVDIAFLRRAHPRMRFIGHFDKMTMTRGESAMRAEFERLLPTARQGGYLMSVDHQTPPGVSLEQYRLFLRLFREAAEQAVG